MGRSYVVYKLSTHRVGCLDSSIYQVLSLPILFQNWVKSIRSHIKMFRYFNSSGSEEFTTKEVIDKMTRVISPKLSPHLVFSLNLQIESDILFNVPCQSEIDAYTSKDLPVYAFSFDYASKGKINFQVNNNYKNYPFFPILYTVSNKNSI